MIDILCFFAGAAIMGGLQTYFANKSVYIKPQLKLRQTLIVPKGFFAFSARAYVLGENKAFYDVEYPDIDIIFDNNGRDIPPTFQHLNSGLVESQDGALYTVMGFPYGGNIDYVK